MPDIIKVSTSKLTSTANSFQATGNQIKSITNDNISKLLKWKCME